LTAFDSALHYDSASLCLDEVDVEALLGTDNDAAPDSQDAGPANADAGSQSAPSNAPSPDASQAVAGQDSGCRVASGPTSEGYSTLLLALVALLGIRVRRFVE
jgi:MYXO-CTERM domain-containing protein